MTTSDGNLTLGRSTTIAPTAIVDTSTGPVAIGNGVRIGHYSIVYPNTVIGDDVQIGAHTSIGIPETGYAMGQPRAGDPGATIAAGTIIRDGVHLYGGVRLGLNVAVGHHTLVRTNAQIGDETQLAHYVSIERGVQLGRFVRSSPHTHLTGDLVAEDRVFFGAGVKTINDRSMHWRTGQPIELEPPVFRLGASVGSGSTVGAGVEVGTWAMIGSHSLALTNVDPYTIVIGTPARYLRHRTPPSITTRT